MAEYKKLKEDFVSGLTGGPVGEINLVTAVVPVRFPHSCPPSRSGRWNKGLCALGKGNEGQKARQS
ncbi:hypothetical protein IMZ48_20385 [Candidatus Bathyarchaeota archaeon]|nr:hypothetical protein [Candidatus Bathyarchaeota archaeon]